MNATQMLLLFAHTLVVCLAIVGLGLYWQRHLRKPPPSADNASAAPSETAAGAETASAPNAADDGTYQQRPLLASQERTIFDALRGVLGEDTLVFPCVAAWGIVEAKKPNAALFGRLAGTSFDFVLCDAATLQPFCGLLLKRDDARNRPPPEFRKACEAAEFPLLELDPEDAAHDPRYLRKALGLPEN